MKVLIPYVGSKKFLLKDINTLFPEKINNYYEPFVGGGSVFFYINENYDIKKNYINDIDCDVINIYKVIKNNTSKLIQYLENLNKHYSKKDFSILVDTFNNKKKQNNVLLAAIYIYLKKRCFNSQFNTKDNIIRPYYAKTLSKNNIYDEKNINDIKLLLKNTIVKSKDYNTFLNEQHLKKNDFVFLDPPYLTTQTKYFYTNEFNIDNYTQLKKTCDKLNKHNINFMLTTNKHTLLQQLFKEYNMKIVKKHSRISRGKSSEYEIIITNY